ncbi:MAG: hypothetical protein MUC49_09110 [Raineya sp.]|jgi:hypothetical protein|nr:hypothetical protein [Raineya sp.]
MEISKKWEKLKNNEYAFLENDVVKGVLTLEWSGLQNTATAIIHDETYKIKRKGFWKNKIQIENKNERVVLEVEVEKWYSNDWIITHEGRKYRLEIRNNSLSEYVIFEGDQEIISYGLHTNKTQIATRIKAQSKSPILFDFLLFYMFHSVSAENGADTVFLTMIA